MSLVVIVVQTSWTKMYPNKDFHHSACWQSITGVLCCLCFSNCLTKKTDTNQNNPTPKPCQTGLRRGKSDKGRQQVVGVSRDWLHSHCHHDVFCRLFCFPKRSSTIFLGAVTVPKKKVPYHLMGSVPKLPVFCKNLSEVRGLPNKQSST